MSERSLHQKCSRIKELRKENNLTLAELAKETNLAPNTISQYENSKRNPSTKAANRLADFFDVSTQYLLGNESEAESGSDYVRISKKEYKRLKMSDKLLNAIFIKIVMGVEEI